MKLNFSPVNDNNYKHWRNSYFSANLTKDVVLKSVINFYSNRRMGQVVVKMCYFGIILHLCIYILSCNDAKKTTKSSLNYEADSSQWSSHALEIADARKMPNDSVIAIMDYNIFDSLRDNPSIIDRWIKLKYFEFGRIDSAINLSRMLAVLCHHKQLKILSLSDSKFGITSGGLCGCDSLVSLSLHDDRIYIIDSCIAGLHNLRDLDLSNNSIDSIPENLSQLNQLISLNLDDNPSLNILQIFRILSKMRNLRELTIRLPSNFRGNIPSIIGSLSSLEKLIVKNWQPSIGIPSEMKNLMNLKLLYLYGCGNESSIVMQSLRQMLPKCDIYCY